MGGRYVNLELAKLHDESFREKVVLDVGISCGREE